MKFNVSLVLLLVTLTGCQKETKKNNKLTTKNEKRKMTQKSNEGLKSTLIKQVEKESPMPEIGNTVSVHYTGWLALEDHTQGRQIDSSLEREPLSFIVGLHQVIKGFEEGVKLMRVGEKRRFVISPEMGYGKKGVGLFIPPDSTLIFDVELLKIS